MRWGRKRGHNKEEHLLEMAEGGDLSVWRRSSEKAGDGLGRGRIGGQKT